MSAWTAFGFGILVGAALFDQLWRYVNRLTDRAAELRAETSAIRASAIEAGTAETVGLGPKDESAGPQDDATSAHPVEERGL